MNLTELLENTAREWPEKASIIDGESVVSYQMLAGQTIAYASILSGLNLSPGSRVGICFPNSVEYVVLTFALWRIGAVVVPIPMECAPEEVKTLSSSMGLSGILSRICQAESSPIASDIFYTPREAFAPSDNHGLNLAFIRFTSGTTSERKGVALTHETILDRIIATNEVLQIGPDDTVMWRLPMSHHFLVTILLYLARGATIVLSRHVFARPFLEATQLWKGTLLYAAPFYYGMLARDNSDLKLDSVRLAVSTTCGLPEETSIQFRKRFGLPLSQALGVIELGLVCVNVDDPSGRWNSVGRPLPSFTVKILRPEADGFGEVAVSGPGIFDAYTHPWTSREALMPGNQFATGDIGRLDADGFLYLKGRKMAVINLAGRKVFPEEIEEVLNRHPDVQESRVYGAPHQRLGEVVEAEVVLRESGTAESLREFCRVHLSPDKIPFIFHFVPVVARSAVTGKIRRQAVAPVSLGK